MTDYLGDPYGHLLKGAYDNYHILKNNSSGHLIQFRCAEFFCCYITDSSGDWHTRRFIRADTGWDSFNWKMQTWNEMIFYKVEDEDQFYTGCDDDTYSNGGCSALKIDIENKEWVLTLDINGNINEYRYSVVNTPCPPYNVSTWNKTIDGGINLVDINAGNHYNDGHPDCCSTQHMEKIPPSEYEVLFPSDLTGCLSHLAGEVMTLTREENTAWSFDWRCDVPADTIDCVWTNQATNSYDEFLNISKYYILYEQDDGSDITGWRFAIVLDSNDDTSINNCYLEWAADFNSTDDKTDPKNIPFVLSGWNKYDYDHCWDGETTISEYVSAGDNSIIVEYDGFKYDHGDKVSIGYGSENEEVAYIDDIISHKNEYGDLTDVEYSLKTADDEFYSLKYSHNGGDTVRGYEDIFSCLSDNENAGSITISKP